MRWEYNKFPFQNRMIYRCLPPSKYWWLLQASTPEASQQIAAAPSLAKAMPGPAPGPAPPALPTDGINTMLLLDGATAVQFKALQPQFISVLAQVRFFCGPLKIADEINLKC